MKKAESNKVSSVTKPAKKREIKITKDSSVMGQVHELEWIGQCAKAIEFKSQAVNLYQKLEK